MFHKKHNSLNLSHTFVDENCAAGENSNDSEQS